MLLQDLRVRVGGCEVEGVNSLLVSSSRTHPHALAIAISIAMFSTHRYHFYLGFVTFATSALLTILVIHQCDENRGVSENEHWRTDTNQSARSLESADNDPKSW